MKQYEKVAFFRFFGLFFGAFMLMFIILVSLYYHKESTLLKKSFEEEMKMQFIDCSIVANEAKKLDLIQVEDCNKYNNYSHENIDFSSLYKEMLYSLLVLFFFIPISLYLAFFSLRPIHQASTMIDNFIANIVHDINTPIASIMLNAKSLLKKSQEEPKKLKRILSSAKQLTDMQHDLLALADEKTEIEKEELKVKETVKEIVDGFKLQYPNQTFELKLEEQNVLVNIVDFRRIIQNLISNSVKYNRDDNVIKIYTREQLFIIEDQGKGMAEPEKVFQKNYREDYTIQGNGLGLASVLAMLERNNIDIHVKSKLNTGTQITLNFH